MILRIPSVMQVGRYPSGCLYFRVKIKQLQRVSEQDLFIEFILKPHDIGGAQAHGRGSQVATGAKGCFQQGGAILLRWRQLHAFAAARCNYLLGLFE